MYEKYKYTSNRAYQRGMASRKKIIEFVSSYLKKHGYSPLQSEIVIGTGLSHSSVNRYFWEFVDKGIFEIDSNATTQRIIKALKVESEDI